MPNKKNIEHAMAVAASIKRMFQFEDRSLRPEWFTSVSTGVESDHTYNVTICIPRDNAIPADILKIIPASIEGVKIRFLVISVSSFKNKIAVSGSTPNSLIFSEEIIDL